MDQGKHFEASSNAALQRNKKWSLDDVELSSPQSCLYPSKLKKKIYPNCICK